MDIELEKLKKLEHALCDAIDILRDWQVEEVKQEKEEWIVYLSRQKDRVCYLTACRKDRWNRVQKDYGAKTKLFVGSEDEAREWYESREKFKDLIKAWEDGKTIQVYETLFKKWGDCAGTLDWYTDCEYRVKPDCPCEDGMDTKAWVGCEHSEDGKPEYKPYETVDEFIQDFNERFPSVTPRPAYSMPLIWLRRRSRKEIELAIGFKGCEVQLGRCLWGMSELFEYYIYLDGTPVGMEVKE